MELPLLVTLSVNQANVVPTSNAAQTNRHSPLANNDFFVDFIDCPPKILLFRNNGVPDVAVVFFF